MMLFPYNVRKRGNAKSTERSTSYCKYTKTDRAEIGRYVANHGVANLVRKFKQRFPAIKQ